MPITTRPLVATFALSALLLPGCQQQDEDDGVAAPPAAATATAQESNSSVEALTLSTTIATDAIMSSGSGQTLKTEDKETASLTSSSATADPDGFTFAVSGTVNVDLDATGPGGGDRYPHASGTFSVAYDSSGNGGPVIGSPVGSAGIVAYTVTVTATSDCTFTDPRCNATATIATGSSYTYEVEIVWNWTDANHWSVQSDVDLSSSNLSGSGSRPGVTWTSSVSGARHAVTGLVYNNGTLNITRTVTGDWTVNTVRNGTPHTVVWHRPSLNQIYVTVDGTTYGPYTLSQVWWYWQLSCH
jgi:hypothetical protein